MEKRKMRIFHFCVPSPTGNFGDDILFLATKDTFENIFHDRKIEWINYPLRSHTTDNVIQKANTCDLIVVGGGGLLLKDTNPNQFSGWQWACSIEHLKAIKKPLVIYAIGYNRFRDQEEFDDIFLEHVGLTIEKSAFFSVRNSKSKEALVKYGFPENKIVVNPCPSLFYEPKIDRKRNRGKAIKIGVNLAGDREHLRFGDKRRFYSDLRGVFKGVIDKGYKLHFLNHNWNPASNCQDFIDEFEYSKIVHNIETVWDRKDIDKAVNLYRSMDLIIAMRGHAQMVPFGQRKRVISLISHNKLGWFLEDVGMEDTGVDISERLWYKRLPDLIGDVLNSKSYVARQKRALAHLKSVYERNKERIRGELGG